MAVLRQAHHKKYTCITNALSQNNSLSLAARGLMLYLLSLPDDWKVHVNHLVKTMKEGKHAILNILKELKEAGYIHLHKQGFKEGWNYFIFESPIDENGFKEFLRTNRFPNNSETEQFGNQQLQSTKEKKEEITKVVNNVPPDSQDEISHILKDEDKKKALDMSEYFLSKILKYFPKIKLPNLQKWLIEIDRIHRIDKRSYEEIKEMIDWSLENVFWCSQIHSPTSLRKHWDKMYAQKNPPNNKCNLENINRSVAKEIKDALGVNDPNFWMSAKEVGHRGLKDAIPISMNPEEFKRTLMKWFDLVEK